MTAGALLLLALCALPAHAHELRHEVAQATAVVIRLSYADDSPFAFEAYEILPEGGKLPAQVGRTDAAGRIAFLPPQPGRWRVKAWSGDGHGLEFTLESGPATAPVEVDKPLYERHARIVAGVALILGLFGIMSLYVKRKKP